MPPSPNLLRQILAILTFAGSSAVASGFKLAPSVAVLDFKERGLSRSFADSIAARLSLEMARTGAFRLPEESEAGRREGKQDLCMLWGCAIRIGQERHVERFVVGSVEIERGILVLTTRMMDVNRKAPLGKIVFRTDMGRADLLHRGSMKVAETFALDEKRLDSARSGIGSAASAARDDRLRKEMLQANQKPWAITSGSTFVAADFLFAVGIFLEARRVQRCSAEFLEFFTAPEGGTSQESSCSDSHLVPNAWVGSGLALGGIALVSGAMTIRYGLQLRELARKPTVELSFRPSMDPTSGALGLATRLEF